jgi:TetR/AcrR family transcriptional repressor of nem operon
MRYEKGHKETTRRRILDVASRQFRENGIAATGMTGIMAESGLTNGAFYSHFESKDDLIRAALTDALEKQHANLGPAGPDTRDFEALIRGFLSAEHRDNPGGGCPSSALVSEIAHLPPPTRAEYTKKLLAIADRIQERLPAAQTAEASRRSLAIFALVVGVIQLARAVDDRELSDRILASGVEAALDLGAPASVD